MPRTTGPIQRVQPAKARTGVVNAPARLVNTQARTATLQRATPKLSNVPGVPSQILQNPVARVPQTTSAASCCCASCVGLQCLDRTNYFAGQLLTEADLTNDQTYYLAKNRLHNRYLQGWGIVCGLQVLCSECDGWVTIKAGYAIDPCGNDIIVCSDQSFNVLNAIQACCKPAGTTPNCSPLRYSPPPACQDVEQQWCITVQYQEQPTSMITSLQQMSSGSMSCCSGSTSGGCGCGCSGNGSNGSSMSSSSCTCASTQASTSTSTASTGACEPTRIIEGFQFGVTPLSQTETTGTQPGTLVYQLEQCLKGLIQLLQQAPSLANDTQQQAYQATCTFVTTVQQYFSTNPTLTNCAVLDVLNAITVPAPGQVVVDYQAILDKVGLILIQALKDCICVALLPQCPPDPCDTRVPLACVTVKNGVITQICHFECRKQLIGYTALHYWLEPLFAGISSLVDSLLEELCCAAPRDKGIVNTRFAYDTANFTTAGFTNAAMFNRAVNTYMAQKLGASLINTTNPTLRAVDTRPFVGETLEDARASLLKQGFTEQQLDVQRVDDDPSWNAAAVAAGSQFAPAAVSAGQPLTLYVKGDSQSIVGIEFTDPTRTLTLQVNKLSSTVSQLQAQLNNMQSGQAPAGTNLPGSAPSAPSEKKG